MITFTKIQHYITKVKLFVGKQAVQLDIKVAYS